MYLTQGQFKGRKIKVPEGVKPTLSKVRESVFNMLTQFSFEDYSFLDNKKKGVFPKILLILL